ncbi:NAD(P)H-binding protein [Janibacter indicus]|uniref:NAD(P)H-binding protein n=1 Tax=Janibacter indicus TaxID=857417 RepID=UPI003D9A591D
MAARLATKGVPLRLLVRDPDRAPDLPGATPVVAPFADGDAVRAALAGVETAFMVSASEAADRAHQHVTFVEAAAAAGVRHLVYLSFQGASPESTFTFARDHAVTEAAIRASGMTWTFLRDSFYADFMPGLVGDDGIIRGPGGDGRVAVVAQDDIADAAAAVLLDPAAHAGRTYTLTGPAALPSTRSRRSSASRAGATCAMSTRRSMRLGPHVPATALPTGRSPAGSRPTPRSRPASTRR